MTHDSYESLGYPNSIRRFTYKKYWIRKRYEMGNLWRRFRNFFPRRRLRRVYERTAPTFLDSADVPYATTSMLCRQDFFQQPFFRYWYDWISDDWQRYLNDSDFGKLWQRNADEIVYHRKLWEFVYIIHSLFERRFLTNHKRGLGFAVGMEPLPALFARWGCDILATDLESEKAEESWGATGQHCHDDLAVLNRSGICPPEQFARSVAYRNVDMNAIPDDLNGFDFCWSSCAFEHLGSIENGLTFVKNAMKTLKPGGIAVHTTEFNLSSNTKTIDHESNFVIFRRCDIERLIRELEDEGHQVEPIDLFAGRGVVDKFVDLWPYFRKGMHLKLLLCDYVTTSLGLIIRKGER